MPSGKKLRAFNAEPEAATPEPVEEEAPVTESAEAVELTTSSVEETPVEEAPVEKAPAKKSRRRSFLRRKKDQPAASPAETPAEGDAQAQEQADEQPAETVDAEVPAGATTEAVDAQGDAEVQPDGEITTEDVVLVPHRPAGKRLKVAAAAAAALFVAGGAFLGATAQPVIANRALVETKLNIARTAANAITTLWSYTPENMDSLGERSARYLTGDFAAQYKKFIDSIVATNKQAQVTNTTSVLGTAVESVSATDASAVVYTNSVATSPVSKNIPSLRYLSYRLEMKRDRTEWRITRMTTITTLDLTPQL